MGAYRTLMYRLSHSEGTPPRRGRRRVGLVSWVSFRGGWQVDISRNRADTTHLSLQRYAGGLVLGLTIPPNDYYNPSLRVEW